VNRLGEGQEFKIGGKSYCHTYSHILLRRARQRLLYVVAAQETLICLTREDVDKQLAWRKILRLYEGQPIHFIIQTGEDKGRLGKFESPLDQRLLGVDFFDYDAAARSGRRPNRVRECPVCSRIFWAGRLDKEQCGDDKCKSTLSSRLSRNPELREIYNKARKKKRAKAKLSS
jgi:hypothetical protein